jgi:prolyl oligopeptidase
VREARVKPGDTRLWFTFESYSVPFSTWVVDLAAPDAGAATRYAPQRLETLPTATAVENLVSERVDLPSKDGTKIPVFLLRHKDTPLDGSAPTVLYGYGGFRVGQYPAFSRSWAVWAEQGGVYAAASLRGGDEFGEDWHSAGCLGTKQNVFDDMIACADGLVAAGKVTRERLAIMGGSNGGLLVATVANQRPDLCRAVVCSVPLIDMLRYHRFQYALSWTKEYGDPDVKEHFDWIRPYSPYHNVKDGAAYPAALVTAGLKDGRVDAFHARKIVARWQAATTSDRPILLSLDRESGHGAASLLQAKRQILDRFCFLRMELGEK